MIKWVFMIELKRKTVISEQVLRVFKTSSSPISIAQLSQRLKQDNYTPNPTTLYRIIEKLTKGQTLSTTTLKNGTRYYELTKETHHHHHFFCTQCEALFCLKNCQFDHNNMALNTLLPSQQFTLTGHELNLYGTCDQCQNNDTKNG